MKSERNCPSDHGGFGRPQDVGGWGGGGAVKFLKILKVFPPRFENVELRGGAVSAAKRGGPEGYGFRTPASGWQGLFSKNTNVQKKGKNLNHRGTEAQRRPEGAIDEERVWAGRRHVGMVARFSRKASTERPGWADMPTQSRRHGTQPPEQVFRRQIHAAEDACGSRAFVITGARQSGRNWIVRRSAITRLHLRRCGRRTRRVFACGRRRRCRWCRGGPATRWPGDCPGS